MSLIEHWLTVREAYAIASDEVQDCARGAGDPGDVRSKLVPADQLQGAVSLADVCAFLRAATYPDPTTGGDRHPHGYKAAATDLERHFGGQ